MIAHATFTMCFTSVVLLAALRARDPSQEEAAMDLGATPMRAFALVVLPAIAPSLASAFLLAFTLSLDDLVIASFTRDQGDDAADADLFAGRLGVTPEVNAISTLLLGFVGLILAISALALNRPAREDAGFS